MAKAIVTGASGFIGTHLVRRLASSGRYEVVEALDLLPPRERIDGVRYHIGDVREPLAAELGLGADIIYNLAAVHRTPGHQPFEYYEANVRGAVNVVGLATSARIPVIVFTSSISVYGPQEHAVSEASATRPTSDYGRSKLLAEAIHSQWAASTGGRLVIVRPGVVFGPGEQGNYTRLANALRGGYFVYPGRRDTIKSGGYVEELLLALEFALSTRDGHAILNFAYPQQSTISDIVETFSKVVGTRAEYPRIPTGVMLLAASLFEAANAVGLRNSIHSERILKLAQSTIVEPGWLVQNGYVFTSDLRSALERWRCETNGRFD